MAYEEIKDLSTDTTISLGGFNKKLKKDNPTEVEGYYIGSKIVKSAKGDSYLYSLQTPEGTVGVWGKTDLDRKMAQVELGTMIRIVQSGSVPTKKGNEMYLFKVYQDTSNILTEEPNSEFSDYSEDTTDESPADEVIPTRASRPAVPAQAPSASLQAKAQALLNKNRSKTA